VQAKATAEAGPDERRPGGEGSAGDGEALANREDPEGKIQSQECCAGKPGQEWTATRKCRCEAE